MNKHNELLRVGLVGASLDKGWSSVAHLPALAALPNVSLTAVGTTREESAHSVRDAVGASHGFTSTAQLAACEDVDLVTVSVKAPLHFTEVQAALMMGKPVYCEWPVGTCVQQTERLAEIAREKGLRTFTGLQGRASPAINSLRALIDSGYVGKVMAVTLNSVAPFWGAAPFSTYGTDIRMGANLLTIPGGHCFDALTNIVGDFASVSAEVVTLIEEGVTRDLGQKVRKTAPDHISVSGRLKSGGVVSATFLGAYPGKPSFQMRIVGDEGMLLVEGGGLPGSCQLKVSGMQGAETELKAVEIPVASAPYLGLDPNTPAFNMAHAYEQAACQLNSGAGLLGDFNHAVKMHRLLDAILAASRTGRRQYLD